MKLWNNAETHKTKFLDFTEALQESGRLNEKNKIDLEVRNKTLNPENPDIIKDIMKKLVEWYGIPESNETTVAWQNF